VEWYRREKAPQRKKALQHYAKQATVADAIRAAAMAETADGIMDDHQRRVGHDRCAKAMECLLERERDIRRARSFDELHRRVRGHKAGAAFRGARALRHGGADRGKVGLRPEKVYLHCGTRKGARELGLASARGVVERDNLPYELRGVARRIQRAEVLERMAVQTLVHPIRHGARVRLPPGEREQRVLFE
jgi:hypothetical protein